MDLLELLKDLDRTQWKKRDYPPLKCPILSRYDLQKMQAPQKVQGDFVTKTSGSTGIPVEIYRTHASYMWWNATTLREVLWHKRDLSLSFAVIRPIVTQELTLPQWGTAFALLGRTGPLYAHPVQGDLNQWLQKIQPGYLHTYPSILETIDLSALKNLKGIKTTGETIIHKHPLIVDTYSSEEVGTIAIQCPNDPENYHVMENIVLEILDDKDQPAQTGRVILTDLTSRYLYRYDIGDYAEWGKCQCGRGLQTIKKILGRKRNMVILPDGTRHWPQIGSREFRKIAPIKRFQAVQTGTHTIELRLVVEKPLTLEQEKALSTKLQDQIGYPFAINFVYLETFPLGKFEEFICGIQ